MKLTEDNCAVKVAVRERPIFKRGLLNADSIISYHSVNNNILIVDGRPFSFDHALGPKVTQQELFEDLIKPLIDKTLQGFYCTALAYGQTGTGKTFTMGLHTEENFNDESVGVIPRALTELFKSADSFENGQKPEISVSLIEIYNEKVFDLLAENSNDQINTKGCKFAGGMKIPIVDINDGYNVLIKGNKNRHVRPTKMNLNSSRSHAIFTIHVVTKTDIAQTSASLHLVDLAGSEGVRRTGHQGVALAEGVNINQGLLSIGKVLQALSIGGKVIPYRDSVLSLVLQDSLNTNSYLTLLACISPHREDLSETLSTLRFAQNAKSLKNTPQINSILLKIKKNKAKTPSKEQTLPLRQRNGINDTSTPNKGKYSTKEKQMSATKRPAPFYSNTFCTPSKMKKVDAKKFNQSEFGFTQKEKSKQMVKDGLTKFDLANVVQRNSDFNLNKGHNDTIDSRSSLLSLNISTSTAIDAPITSSYSPIIRHMTKMEHQMKEMLDKLKETKVLSYSPDQRAKTPSASTDIYDPQNGSQWDSIKQELEKIVRKEILSLTTQRSAIEVENDENRTKKIDNARCKLFSESPVFKVPHPPLEKSGSKDEQSVLGSFCSETSSNNFSQDGNQTVLPQARRSLRLSIVNKSNISNMEKEEKPRQKSSRVSSIANNSHIQTRRRSFRIEKSKANECNSCNAYTPNVRKSSKKRTKAPTRNEVIAGYFNMSTITETPIKNLQSAKLKHQKAVLEIINTGSMRELQILPQIGLKTAYQIITHRTLNGKFKNFKEVGNVPVWRGKFWERFKELNNITED